MATLSLLAGCPGAETHCFGTVSRPKCVLACLLACLLAGGRAGLPACLALPCLALPCLASGLLHSWHPPASTLLARPRGRGWCWVGVPAVCQQQLGGNKSRRWPLLAGALDPRYQKLCGTGYLPGCASSSWLRWDPSATGAGDPDRDSLRTCGGGATRGNSRTATPRLRGAANKVAARKRFLGGGPQLLLGGSRSTGSSLERSLKKTWQRGSWLR